MKKDQLTQIIEYCTAKGYPISAVRTTKDQLVFEERVKMNCFYCGEYGNSWRCPPRIPVIDFNKMFDEYENIAFIYITKDINKGVNYNSVRSESSVELHRALLECEKWLWDNNNSTSLSFIGGRCKLCKNGCAPNKCANPYESRTPVEALGINVLKSAANVGIDISFPPKEVMIRVGLLLW